MKIVVLMGGRSDERDVSLASGAQVAKALREAGHLVTAFDTAAGSLTPSEEAAILDSGVGSRPPSREALDALAEGDTTSLSREPLVRDADLFFLALHGGVGEDGTLQALLDMVGKPYTGSGVVGSALAMDKDLSKRLMRDAGIVTPEWLTGLRDPPEVVERLGLPLVVKAASGGSSLRLLLAHDAQELEAATEEARTFEDEVLYERYVMGREFTVGVLGGEPLPVGEIVPEHELFDYECKYQPGLAQEIFPADLPGEHARHLQRLAVETHRVLRLGDFSRVDFILDESGKAWCLEANALPGMTANSLVPKAARAAGISFPQLCDRIAQLALARSGATG